MPRIDSTVSTLALAAVIAFATFSTVMRGVPWPMTPAQAQSAATGGTGTDARPAARWAASATGRIEPASGTIRIAPQAAGLIVEVPVGINQFVESGDLVVRLDDKDVLARIDAARAEVEVRKRERAEEPATGLALERQQAEDNLADARSELFAAWRTFDMTLARKRANEAKVTDVVTAREAIETARKKVSAELEDVARVSAKANMPLPTRLETSLTVARSDLALAEAAFERTRIRAPFDGTVLNVYARAGETAVPSPDAALLLFGDIAKLRVRAEVEERDVAKVRVGQKVIVKADAFPDQDFAGTVTEIASALGSPRIASRGPRRPNDVDVLEVVADLEGTPPLLTGMRVDVFFKSEGEVRSSAAGNAQR
ncbi:MAG: efflux RND transporter periplasmic adaptor subunit [Hyphomicrobiaceae bacterium]|nr:efflux RND transporter periplasmic adaptor subunit [Hyphomicrobiaceae bacterium]